MADSGAGKVLYLTEGNTVLTVYAKVGEPPV